jgi:hypothetical protein
MNRLEISTLGCCTIVSGCNALRSRTDQGARKGTRVPVRANGQGHRLQRWCPDIAGRLARDRLLLGSSQADCGSRPQRSLFEEMGRGQQ